MNIKIKRYIFSSNAALSYQNKKINLIKTDEKYKEYQYIGSNYFIRGKILFLLGRYEEAKEDLNLSLSTGSPEGHGYSLAKVHRYLGKIYSKTNEKETAEIEFEKAISLYTKMCESRIDDISSEGFNGRGKCYYNLGLYEKTQSDFMKVIAINEHIYPDACSRTYSLATKNMGLTLWKKGDKKNAINYLRKAIKLFYERKESYYAREIENAITNENPEDILVLFVS
ncbi:tetratricopeptide repeat protein [Desulfosarcina ovata]|uniref:Uncharacterized protein n=1 Tax=Desulfosarcina ovata subsp. ovata TaxID=2752305 RepID=A0A5K8A9D6_9BACT|nr:tetratricopeptide repeat protein [Desulfosarcina ovata]BBO89185.1 hypothetical protein DSCOOX_23650 [Desulfosarcina ovata subsp. ovata]